MTLSEHIRENIRKMLDEALAEAKPHLNIDPKLKHMLTQICYEMFKHGLKDGYRMCIKTLEVGKENLDE